MKPSRKKWICYPPNYRPGDGYEIVRSNLQAKKTLVRLGVGAEAVPCFLRWGRDGSCSWWNNEGRPELHYFEEPS